MEAECRSEYKFIIANVPRQSANARKSHLPKIKMQIFILLSFQTTSREQQQQQQRRWKQRKIIVN